MIISFPIVGKFSTIISSSIFSWSFFLSSSSGTPMIQMLGHLTLSWRSLRLSTFLLIHFTFFLCFIYFYQKWQPTPEFCLENPMDGGAQLATVRGVAKSLTRMSDFTITIHYLSSTSLILSSASVILLFVPSRVFLISFIVLFIIY